MIVDTKSKDTGSKNKPTLFQIIQSEIRKVEPSSIARIVVLQTGKNVQFLGSSSKLETLHEFEWDYDLDFGLSQVPCNTPFYAYTSDRIYFIGKEEAGYSIQSIPIRPGKEFPRTH